MFELVKEKMPSKAVYDVSLSFRVVLASRLAFPQPPFSLFKRSLRGGKGRKKLAKREREGLRFGEERPE